jgi:DNA-binding transcriptional ArsR family regulator
MRAVHHPPIDEVALPEVLHALSDPIRLDIVSRLAKEGEMACGALNGSISKSTLSHHLKVLREAGVTTTRVEGTTRIVSLRRKDLQKRFPGLMDRVLGCAGNVRSL